MGLKYYFLFIQYTCRKRGWLSSMVIFARADFDIITGVKKSSGKFSRSSPSSLSLLTWVTVHVKPFKIISCFSFYKKREIAIPATPSSSLSCSKRFSRIWQPFLVIPGEHPELQQSFDPKSLWFIKIPERSSEGVAALTASGWTRNKQKSEHK